MRRMLRICTAAVALGLTSEVAHAGVPPTSPPDSATAISTGLAAELFANLPSKKDFDAAAVHAAMTLHQRAELEPRIADYYIARKKREAKVAIELKPAIEIMLTIPREEDDEDHIEKFEQIGLIMEEVATRNHNRLDQAFDQCESAASGILGVAQRDRWIEHLRSSKRLTGLDPNGLSNHREFDSRIAGDLSCIPDLQLVANWFFDMHAPNTTWSLEHDAETGPAVRAHLALVTKHLNDLFAKHAQSELLDGIQLQLAQIQGREDDARRLLRKVTARKFKMIEVTTEGMDSVATILHEAGLEGHSDDWRQAIRIRMFSTTWGPTRVDAFVEAFSPDGVLASSQQRSLGELYAEFRRVRAPILTSVEQRLIKEVKTAKTPLHVLSLRRRIRQCEPTQDLDLRYHDLINTTLEDMMHLLDADQHDAYTSLISHLKNGRSGQGSTDIW